MALREPLAGDAVQVVVQQVADTWQRILDALVGVLTSDASPVGAHGHGRGPLIESWRQRLHAHEYARLAGLDLIRAERVERWTWDELGAGEGPSRPADMHRDELYVRAPVEVTHLGNEKVFDDVIVLLLRPEEGHYKVSAYGEVEGPR